MDDAIAELLRLGDQREADGEPQEALPLFERALARSRTAGDARAESQALHSLGSAHQALGNTTRALEFYEPALPLRLQLEDWRGAAGTANNMGMIHYQLEDYGRAEAYFRQALDLSIRTRDPFMEAVCREKIGFAVWELGRRMEAVECMRRGRDLKQENGYPTRGEDQVLARWESELRNDAGP